MKIKLSILIILFALFSFTINAQSSTQLDQVESTESESQPMESSSSIAGGLLIILSLGIGYASRKIYEIRNRHQNDLH